MTPDESTAAFVELDEITARLEVTHPHLDADARARKARRVAALLAHSRDPSRWTSAGVS